MADIATTPNCFRLCQKGSNVAVDGNVLNFVKAADAVRRVQSEIRHPSRKTEGIGLRPIEDLDDVLDNLL
jgi:(2Fe-2S) ferredoxin